MGYRVSIQFVIQSMFEVVHKTPALLLTLSLESRKLFYDSLQNINAKLLNQGISELLSEQYWRRLAITYPEYKIIRSEIVSPMALLSKHLIEFSKVWINVVETDKLLDLNAKEFVPLRCSEDHWRDIEFEVFNVPSQETEDPLNLIDNEVF
jgi:hypothetical protein